MQALPSLISQNITQLNNLFSMPENVLVWLLVLPVAITIVVISRQIVGIKGVSITTPLLMAFALMAVGLQAGFIIFFTILVAGFIMRSLLKRVRLLYLPKMGLLLSGITAVILLITPFLIVPEDLELPQTAFALVVLILSAEQLASALIERGLRKAAAITIETTLISLVVFLTITSNWLQGVIISYPLFVLALMIIINFFLGKWTGLRFSEYIRFKDIIFK